jgi:tRNA threonylcarbamoyladenosine biosynthesis protein TsaE
VNRLALLSRSPKETEELGRRLGTLLKPGTFVALYGELGSGKTCLTRGIVAGAAPASAHLVASPTFAIMNGYPGDTPVYHFDFYRLASTHEIAELGFEDYLQGDGICIAEWSERLGDLMPRDLLRVTLEHTGEEERRLVFEAAGPEPEALLASFAEMLENEKFL